MGPFEGVVFRWRQGTLQEWIIMGFENARAPPEQGTVHGAAVHLGGDSALGRHSQRNAVVFGPGVSYHQQVRNVLVPG